MLMHAIAQCLLLILALYSSPAPQIVRPQLKKIVGLAAEDGVVAIRGNTLSVFSTGNIRVQDQTNQQWKMADKKADAVSVRVSDTRWRQLPNPLPISTAFGFAFCDPLNQVDIQATDSIVQSVLPPGAKVKSLVHVSDGLTVVVYAASNNTVRYDIRVALLKNEKTGGYSLLEDDLATDAGNFCGVHRGDGKVFFVFADEPSGSSDFSAVYVYGIASRESGRL